MLEKIKESIDYISNKTDIKPTVGIILGTGLGELANEVKISCSINYSDIPHFAHSTVEGHDGKLIIGELGGKQVVVMKGRFHYYEGYSMEEVTYPVRVMKYMGIKSLFVSNACGGMNPDFSIGDIMVITDHINLMPNPLIGKHYEEFGARFPDMSKAYDKKLIELADNIAAANGIKLQKGCYVGVTGPTLETPKEYQYFRIIGGDVVGMSTVPEVIVANQMGIPCFAVSVITDLGVPGKIKEVTHEEVQLEAHKAEPKLALLVKNIIHSL
jgi:purine-nucleoside phosphorylase